MKLGGWMRRLPGTNYLDFRTDSDLDLDTESPSPIILLGGWLVAVFKLIN